MYFSFKHLRILPAYIPRDYSLIIMAVVISYIQHSQTLLYRIKYHGTRIDAVFLPVNAHVILLWHLIINKQLTRLPLDKMAAISQMIFSDKKCCILIRISLKFFPKGPINNSPALV